MNTDKFFDGLDNFVNKVSTLTRRLRDRNGSTAQGDTRMQFLDRLQVPVRFADAKLIATNPDKRKARYTFALDLDDDLVKRLPAPVHEAYKAMVRPDGAGRVAKLTEIKGRTINLCLVSGIVPSRPFAQAVDINRLLLEKISSKGGTRSLVTLFFSFELDFDEGYGFSRYVGATVFFTNYATQKELPLT